jgi:hypothetical protein
VKSGKWKVESEVMVSPVFTLRFSLFKGAGILHFFNPLHCVPRYNKDMKNMQRKAEML